MVGDPEQDLKEHIAFERMIADDVMNRVGGIGRMSNTPCDMLLQQASQRWRERNQVLVLLCGEGRVVRSVTHHGAEGLGDLVALSSTKAAPKGFHPRGKGAFVWQGP